MRVAHGACALAERDERVVGGGQAAVADAADVVAAWRHFGLLHGASLDIGLHLTLV